MKKSILLLSIVFTCCNSLFAQLSYNFKHFGIGIGGGVSTAFADLTMHKNGPAAFGNLDYNITPYITVTGELQGGKLSGGDPHSDKDSRAFSNHFAAALLYMDFQLGEIVDYRYSAFWNAVKGFYVGGGVGIIHNTIVSVQRTSLLEAGYVFPGRDISTEPMLGIRAGYEFKIYNFYQEPNFRLRLGVESNLAYGEGLDGYNDPPNMFRNNKVDRYTILSVGLRYNFGNPLSYKKPIRGYY